jgi:tetratricopeptide (TPR) repeat protein
VHFFDSSGVLHHAYAKIASCYFYEKQYGQSADFYTLALANQNNASQEKNYSLNKASALIKSGNFLAAREELLFLTDTNGIGKNYLLLMGISYFGSEEEEKSKPYFLSLLSENKQKQEEMNLLFKRLKKINRKNPDKATFMSRAIPGLGQLYAGDFKSGFNSMLLNGGLTVLGLYVGINIGWIDALFMVGPWLQRYYTGGVNKTAQITIDQKNIRKSEVFNQMMHVLGSEIH